MRSIQFAPTCCLNFDLNFTKFPNSEIGKLKLRLLVTGVEVELRVELGSSWANLKPPIINTYSLQELSQASSELETWRRYHDLRKGMGKKESGGCKFNGDKQLNYIAMMPVMVPVIVLKSKYRNIYLYIL
jgi:hypothetical protein